MYVDIISCCMILHLDWVLSMLGLLNVTNIVWVEKLCYESL